MEGKRSNVEIMADILKVAEDGASKSHIVYRANLNFKVIKKYLNRLEQDGLIKIPEEGDRIFRTTKKGIKYLEQFKELKTYVSWL